MLKIITSDDCYYLSKITNIENDNQLFFPWISSLQFSILKKRETNARKYE